MNEISNEKESLNEQPERKTNYIERFLLIGQLHISIEPTCVWTVLGSCVSVVLYCPRKKISAICHSQLAEKKEYNHKCSDTCPAPCHKAPVDSEFRYVTCAVGYMMERFLSMGISKNEIKASIYGGSNMLPNIPYDIGGENILVAYKMLSKYGVKVVKHDTGGKKGRTINHYSDTGITIVKNHRDRV